MLELAFCEANLAVKDLGTHSDNIFLHAALSSTGQRSTANGRPLIHTEDDHLIHREVVMRWWMLSQRISFMTT